MFIKTVDLTEEQKREVAEMCGKITYWFLEGRSIQYIADELKLKPIEVLENMAELAYEIRKRIGRKHFLKILFRK